MNKYPVPLLAAAALLAGSGWAATHPRHPVPKGGATPSHDLLPLKHGAYVDADTPCGLAS